MMAPQDHIPQMLGKLRSIYRKPPFHDQLNKAVERLYRNLHSDGDRRIIVLVGEAGVGKSRAMRQALLTHTAFSDCHRVFDCPSPCSIGAMGMLFLRNLGHPVTRENFRDHSLIERIEATLPHSGVNLMLIDEAQHALNSASELKLTGNRDFWKRLTQQDYPFGLILSGTPRVAEVVLQDRQLSRRTIVVEARRLVGSDADDTEGLIVLYAKEAGLKYEIPHDLASRVIHASAYAFGEVCKLIIAAIEDALITSQMTLTIDNFASAYAADTDCDPQMNPFLARQWQGLQPSGAAAMATDTAPRGRRSR